MGVQKLVCVNVDKVVTDGKRAPTVAKPGQQKKVIVKPKPEEVIAISPDSEKKVVEKQEKKAIEKKKVDPYFSPHCSMQGTYDFYFSCFIDRIRDVRLTLICYIFVFCKCRLLVV